jgi:hypothetical protein
LVLKRDKKRRKNKDIRKEKIKCNECKEGREEISRGVNKFN